MLQSKSVDELRRELTRLEGLAAEGDLFVLLGVSEDSSDAEIKNAYRAYARKLHADVWSGVDLGDDRERLQRVFADLSRAHQTLSHPERKARYMAERSLKAKGVPTEVEALFRAEQEYRAGVRFFERGDLERALARFDEAVKLHPTEAEYKVYQSWTSYALLSSDANADEASKSSALASLETLLKETIADQDNCVPAHLFMGHLKRTQNKRSEAASHYEVVLKHQPHNMEAAASLRRLSRSRGNSSAPKKSGGFFARLLGRG